MPNSYDEQLNSPNPETRRSLAASLRGVHTDEAHFALWTLLGDLDWRIRKTAAEVLSVSPPEAHIMELIKMLYSEDNAGLRSSATEVLANYGSSAMPVILHHLLKTDDEDVLIILLNLLRGGGKDFVKFNLIEPFLKHPNKNVAGTAVLCLGASTEDEAYQILAEALAGDDQWIAFHAAEALGEMKNPNAINLLIARYKEGILKKSILQNIGRIGDIGASEFLIQVLTERRKINLDALEALFNIYEKLARYGDAMAAHRFESLFREKFPQDRLDDLIHKGLKSESSAIATATLEALGWLKTEKSIFQLASALRENVLRNRAKTILVKIGATALPYLVKNIPFVQDDTNALTALLEVIGFIGDPDGVSVLAAYLSHEEAETRQSAAEALGRIGLTGRAPVWRYLFDRLADSNPAIQKSAVDFLSRILTETPVSDAVKEIEKALKDSRPEIRKNALSVYANIGAPKARDALILASKDEYWEVRKTAIFLMGDLNKSEFFPVFAAALSDEASKVREVAVQSIAKLRTPEALDKLKSLLDDEDMWVRAEASEALGVLGAGREEIVKLLIKHLNEDVPPVQIACLKALGLTNTPSATKILLETVERGKGEIRLAAIKSLQNVKQDAALNCLLECLKEKDWKIITTALDAVFNREDAASALPSVMGVLLSSTDPLIIKKIILGMTRLRAKEAMPIVLSFMEQEYFRVEIGVYLREIKKVDPVAVSEALRRLDARLANCAERSMEESAKPQKKR